MDTKEFHKTYLNVAFKKKNAGSIKKAIASYLQPLPQVGATPEEYVEKVYGPNTIIDKELDLFYGLSILVSEGVNKNSDAFLRDILIKIFKTPRHKFIDWEHDVQAKDKKANPDKYQVIGHIYDSTLSTQEGFYIPEWDCYKDSDSKWFSKDSNWRDKALDIIVAWVIYKFEFPEIVESILRLAEEKPDSFGVSMEILFSDYKFRIGGIVDATENFDFDGNTLGVKEVRKGDPLADMFQNGWNEGKNRTYNGLPVTRILGGTIFFSGMAITENRANKRSWNISFAKSQAREFKNQDLIDLVEAIAKKSGSDMSTCKIVNGEPDCECLEKSISSEMEIMNSFLSEMEETLSVIKKRKGVTESKVSFAAKSSIDPCPFCDSEVEDFSDDHISYHVRDLESNLIKAQKKIEDLHYNNLDGDMDQEMLLESIQEIESILYDSQSYVEFLKTTKKK